MTVELKTPIKNKKDVLPLDGTITKTFDDILNQGETEVTAEWEDETKQVIIHVMKSATSVNRTRRYLKDPNTMVLEVDFKSTDGSKHVKMTRIMVRKQ